MTVSQALKAQLLELVQRLDGMLPPASLVQIKSLIACNEPGLALEWIADGVAASDAPPAELRLTLMVYATQLGVTDSIRRRLRLTAG